MLPRSRGKMSETPGVTFLGLFVLNKDEFTGWLTSCKLFVQTWQWIYGNNWKSRHIHSPSTGKADLWQKATCIAFAATFLSSINANEIRSG